MKKILPILIAIIIMAGCGGFFGGMKYAESKKSADRKLGVPPNFGGQNFREQGKTSGNSTGSGFVNGEILGKDEESITVKVSDGGSKIIFFSDMTQITKTAAGTIDELKVGDNVMVDGSANQDGSVAAKTIQLRPNIAS
jgi:hypothetical protein